MKRLCLYSVFLAIPFLCHAQDKEQKTLVTMGRNGFVQSVEFSESDKTHSIPDSPGAFFRDYLKANSNDQFQGVPHTSKRKNLAHQHYDQYYKGIKVDGAGYNFHYRNGKMYFAHGHYVVVNDLNTIPSVEPERAKELFAHYKGIPLNLITDFIAELIIKEIPVGKDIDTVSTIKLVFRIYLYSNHENNTEVGFVDAHSGEVLLTEPNLIDYSAMGTFSTRYSGARQGITHHYGNAYHLTDSTRGAIIHTWNLNGSTNIQSRVELSDNDNNWTAAEHSASENDMGLDVHWAFQQIYVHLNNSYIL